MGIRNLALCLLNIPSPQMTSGQLLQITDWNRVTVSQKPESSESHIPESFEPIDYAAKAYTLMKSSLEMYHPHTILIERQRYRSSGGSAVQEWTVRVNMLESMFHAVLHTISQEHEYDFNVYSVSPRKVTQLWLADIEEKMNARETKGAKIAVAGRIVKGEEMKVKFMGQAEDVAQEFNGKGGGVKKFDDLADAMLQGLGWWKWHVNRSVMMDDILSWEDVIKPEKSRKGTKSRSHRIKRTAVETVELFDHAEDDITEENLETTVTHTTTSRSHRKKALEII